MHVTYRAAKYTGPEAPVVIGDFNHSDYRGRIEPAIDRAADADLALTDHSH
jgi:hypothetical protein